jgi:phosphoglycolate phosphatase
MKRQTLKRVRGIQLVITDLDNTLYDWYASFVPAIYAMVEEAAAITGVEEELLLDELKTVHVRYHNTEQPFSILETPSVEHRFPNATSLERRNLLDGAFRKFSEIRKANLRLFPGVRETLEEIRGQGCVIVGYTEAVVENSLYRLSLLDLLSAFHRLYVPASRSPRHPDPGRPLMHKAYPGFVKLLPKGHRKPDPAVLEDICRHFNIAVSNSLYVGDSMTRDISMAVMARTHSALAAYGGSCPADVWDRLVRITHWTDRDVKLEQRLREEFAGLRAEVELNAFPDLLKYFEFESGSPQPSIAREADEMAFSS